MTKIFTNGFSIFNRGYRNKAGKAVPQNKPLETQTIEWVGEYIKSERAREATQLLRNLKAQETSEAEQKERELKVLSFMYATFSGVFSYRKTDGLLMRSPFICLDFDDLASLDEAKSLREQLSADSHIETELCFVSPRGRGVKWVVTLPERTLGMTFKEQFDFMRDLVGFNYGIEVDKTGSDVSRACFLPYDPECYINPKYQQKKTDEI